MYREQEFVEKCHCGVAAIAPCASCGRARCDLHLARGLCDRCSKFVAHELAQRTTLPWVTSGVTGAGTAVALLAAGLATASLVALPIGIATWFAHRKLLRAKLIRLMGPKLAASKGELPEPPRYTEKFPEASQTKYW